MTELPESAVVYAEFIQPYPMPWSHFMRDYRLGHMIGGEATSAAKARRLIPVGYGATSKHLPGFRVHEARHARDHDLHLRKLRINGLALVATFEGDLAGAIHADLLWVDKAYRGRDLGAELQCERFLRLGPEAWVKNRYTASGQPHTFTAGGLEVRKRAYRLLVKRGVLDPSTEELP